MLTSKTQSGQAGSRRQRGQAGSRRQRGQAGSRRQRGQALVEFIPSMMLFMLVISAALSYFRVMRAAALREEAIRNLAFSKMDNVGTLTTHLGGPQELNLRAEGGSASSADINQGTPCFLVSPTQGNYQVPMPTRVPGVGFLPQVSVKSFGVVYRFPYGNCSPQG